MPEDVISGLAELGGFGLSVPAEYGGFATGGESEYLGMVVETLCELARVQSSQATVMAGIAVALAYYWPPMTSGWPRAALLTGVTALLTWINVRGIRQSAWAVNALTIVTSDP